jgi:uncharacterized protein
MPEIRRLIWDNWNIDHIWQHRVEYWEVEELIRNEPFFTRAGRTRLRMIGQTNAGRYLTAFLDPEGQGDYYVVTARNATDSERRRYVAVRRRL